MSLLDEFTHSTDETRQFGYRINHSVQGLLTDIHNTLVYAYPETIRKLAKATPIAVLADKYNAEAEKLEKRSASKTKEQIDKEVVYSTTYQSFVNNWDEFYDELINDYIVPSKSWTQCEAYDSEFKTYSQIYRDGFKQKQTIPDPKTEEEIKKEHPDAPGSGIFGGLGKIFGDIPWTPILLAGGAYLLWTNRDAVKKAFSSSPEEHKALPEKT
jgi:hypothetical protein